MRALFVALAITSTACFPHNARKRKIAKLAEGAALVTGIAMQFVVRDQACMGAQPGATGGMETCGDGHLDVVGLGLIFAGLAGFAATVMTSPPELNHDDDETLEPPPIAWAAPQTLCSALVRGDDNLAQAALTSQARSVGASTAAQIFDSLHAWLSRQSCIVIEDTTDNNGLLNIQFTAVVGEGVTRRYMIDLSASPTIMLFPQ